MDRAPANWRTHEFSGFETVPQRMPPSFDSSGTAEDLPLADLIHEACATGKTEARIEAPYANGVGRERHTILRTVLVNVHYQREVTPQP